MKKLFLFAIAILSCTFIYSSGPERVDVLSSKVILQNGDGYFVFSDGSCWKVMGFSKRWRTINEWWNNIQLVPENYECVPNDWFLGAQIEVYPKYGNLNVNEADAANQEALKQCTHLLVNSRTGQVLFAIALHPAECIVQVFNEARQEGYSEGFNKGCAERHKNNTEIYNSGYSNGYRAGYAEGCQAMSRERETAEN